MTPPREARAATLAEAHTALWAHLNIAAYPGGLRCPCAEGEQSACPAFIELLNSVVTAARREERERWTLIVAKVRDEFNHGNGEALLGALVMRSLDEILDQALSERAAARIRARGERT